MKDRRLHRRQTGSTGAIRLAPPPDRRWQFWLGAGFLLLVLALLWARPAQAMNGGTSPINAEPDATPAQVYPMREGAGWQEWGAGEMRFFGFRLYRATLWVAGSSIDTAPFALTLHYHRDITRQQLVNSSLDEMRRTGTPEATAEKWRADLERVFPDVREGDRIIGIHLPGTGARFYHQGKLTGEVRDPDFSRRFFAIWLDPKTRSPDVRAMLLKRPASAGG